MHNTEYVSEHTDNKKLLHISQIMFVKTALKEHSHFIIHSFEKTLLINTTRVTHSECCTYLRRLLFWNLLDAI